jgi:myo-inositol 2-dehydrogenase / D-chiro-inositol 1-dehydrogenase
MRYGVIGCGAMGREHIENLKAMGGVDVVALADTHGPSRQAAAALAPQATLHDSAAALLAAGGCDAVVIATPNFTHAEVMRLALAQPSLHILVEKPLVTRIEDGLALLRLAEGRPGIVWVAQEYRYMPPVAEMIRMAHEGRVGRLHQVAIREHRQPFYPKVGDWNRFNTNTGGTLVEKCCHYFNLMELLLREEAQAVFASGGQRVNHLDERYDGRVPDILDSAYVIVEFASGARASLDLCMFAEGSLDNEHLVVVGDEGKLESFLPSGELRFGRREAFGKRTVWGEGAAAGSGTADGVQVRLVRDTGIRYLGQHFGASYVEHVRFAHAIRQGQPAEITMAEGLRAVAIGLAAHKSIAQGRRVALSEVLP